MKVRFIHSRFQVLSFLLAILLLFFFLTGENPDNLPSIGAGTDGKVLDCRTWEEKDYTPVTNRPDTETKLNLSNTEKPQLRIEGWKNAWENGEHENVALGWPKSGSGSKLENTENMRQSLATIIDQLKILLNKKKIRILDAAFGDMTWMQVFLQSRKDVIYSGYDIVPSIVESAKDKFSHELWYFQQLDLLNDQIRGEYDLVVNRNLAQHLTLSDSIQMFYNIRQSRSKFLVTTTFPNLIINDDIHYAEDKLEKRGFHQVNLELFPFHFPTPICINPDSPEMNQHLALWRLSDLSRFYDENLAGGRIKPFPQISS